MNKMNVNGQNGVATSAEMFNNKFNGVMYTNITNSIMSEIGSWTSEQKEGLLNKVRRMHMKNCSAKKFVYNNIEFVLNWGVAPSTGKRIFQIYATNKYNGRYYQGTCVAYREFDNYYGINNVFNILMCDLVTDMFEVAAEAIEDYIKMEKELAADNNMMVCVDKYGQEFIDSVIKEYADIVYNAVSKYDLNDTIEYCVKVAFNDLEYYPEKKRLVGCSVVPDLVDWDNEEEFCEYFNNAYDFDWDSCKKFYYEYCNDISDFANEYDIQMENALRNFDKEVVFDNMSYKINYNNEGYINVYIEMGDFVNYIKNNMIFNNDMAQLFKYEDLGIILYYYYDPNNEDIKQFYKDLIDMLPMVTEVKLYDNGLYFWYNN